MPPPQTLTIDRTELQPKPYQRVGRAPIGAWHARGIGWLAYFDKATQVRVRAYGVDDTVLVPERGMLILRPSTPDGSLIPGTTRPGLTMAEDFRGGGAEGIDPCGQGTLLQFDRTMQRMAVGLFDLATGKPPVGYNPGAYDIVRFKGPTGYAAPANPKPFDGQHLVAGYCQAIPHISDLLVKLCMQAIAYDAELVWNAQREAQILAGPKGQGHGNVGREWAWVAYAAVLAGNRALAARMLRIAKHVVMPWGGLQRLKEGIYTGGSPDPWEVSMVPHGVDVTQLPENFHCVVALNALGETRMASKLANAVCSRPLGKKWLDANTGLPIPSCIHGGDDEQVLAAIGTQPKSFVEAAALKQPIPRHKDYGGANPVAKNLAEARHYLALYDQPGKTAWMQRKLA